MADDDISEESDLDAKLAAAWRKGYEADYKLRAMALIARILDVTGVKPEDLERYIAADEKREAAMKAKRDDR